MLPLHSSVDAENPLIADFRNFLYVCFKHLRPNHPGPTPAQFLIAQFLQHSWAMYGEVLPADRGRLDIIEAFRGIGKSEILACFALWLLLRNPVDEKILVISATSMKAKKFVKQVKEILMTLPFVAHLRPRSNQRDAFDLFDVQHASNTQSPSMQAQGISGQITGDRASTIIFDDIEIPENSATEERRVTLVERTLEFTNIVYPSDPARGYPGGDIIGLGTPQTEESIYTKMIKERHYRAWIYPARYPSLADLAHYLITTEQGRTLNVLCPEVQAAIEDPKKVGKPTDTRFDDATLLQRECQGKLNWSLQYMLDTSISDEARYPLKQRDIMVFPTSADRAPRIVQWGRDTATTRNVMRDIPNWGFTGDCWMQPLFHSGGDDWSRYDTKILYVDTSGRGEDETAWCVLGVLNGTFWLLHLRGMSGADARAEMAKRDLPAGVIPQDSYDVRMELIARDARDFGVDKVWIETNFADGLWTKAFQPVLMRVWPAKGVAGTSGCSCEEVRVSGQKELRICDTLEPVLLNHRMVMNERIAREDSAFGYQLTHISRERGALKHDDRIDCLAGAVQVLQDAIGQEQHEAAKGQRDRVADLEYQAFMEAYTSQWDRWGPIRPVRRSGFESEEDYYEWKQSEVVSSRGYP